MATQIKNKKRPSIRWQSWIDGNRTLRSIFTKPKGSLVQHYYWGTFISGLAPEQTPETIRNIQDYLYYWCDFHGSVKEMRCQVIDNLKLFKIEDNNFVRINQFVVHKTRVLENKVYKSRISPNRCAQFLSLTFDQVKSIRKRGSRLSIILQPALVINGRRKRRLR